MSSLTELTSSSGNVAATEMVNFRRKLLKNSSYRRYIMALFFFLLLLIQIWRELNVALAVELAVTRMDKANPTYTTLSNWTYNELFTWKRGKAAFEIFVTIAGTLLILVFSSHKFLLASTVLASILHMLTPAVLHSAYAIILLYCENVVAAPIYVAIMSLWKDWAPSSERSKLIIFPFSGVFIMTSAAKIYHDLLISPYIKDEYFYYAGISGLIWALFWHNLTSDTPQNDPLISEQEILYLEGNIPSDIQHKIKISNVPWKSIVTSKEVLILCLIFFKVGWSYHPAFLYIYFLHLPNINIMYAEISSIVVFTLIMLCSAVIADILIRKFSGRTLLIRKCFLCVGFTLQWCALLFGTLSSSKLTEAICYFISCIFFLASFPGFFTLALDLSARYVSIIAGLVFVFYTLGLLSCDYMWENLDNIGLTKQMMWLFLGEGILSIVCAVLFGVWGDVEEQLWSLTFTARSRPEGYKCYPRPDEEEDMNLVSENAEGEIFKI